MKFIKNDIIAQLNWVDAGVEEIEATIIGYYGRYLNNVLGSDECPYERCKELYGSQTAFDVSEEVELNTILEYKDEEFSLVITSYIDVNLDGADASDYVYKVEVSCI